MFHPMKTVRQSSHNNTAIIWTCHHYIVPAADPVQYNQIVFAMHCPPPVSDLFKPHIKSQHLQIKSKSNHMLLNHLCSSLIKSLTRRDSDETYESW